MKFIYKFYVVVFTVVIFLNFILVDASSSGTISGNGVRFRSSANTSNTNIIAELSKGTVVEIINSTKVSGSGCSAGWYNIKYNNKVGYVCSSYIDTGEKTSGDVYLRPWTSPEKAIKGGAIFIAESYIKAGQNTSYLKKFNVTSYRTYNHQYMANLAAPYSEAYTSYKSYKANSLLDLPLEFTIPIFNNMPDGTALPGGSVDSTCQSEVLDEEFENQLNAQGFSESYKCKLRLLHVTHPNWTFKALKTNLDFNSAVSAEQKVSSIQGGDKYYYHDGNGNVVQTEKGWYKANNETVSYYLDPRNFLKEERILMFENLGYSENYTEKVVSSILSSTFMSGLSVLDNKSYSTIFVEAGKNASISSVYLASLAIQESGSKGSIATTGNTFTYNNITYTSLFNFFNIGAYSSESSPIKAGMVWAAGGSDSVIVKESTGENDDKKQETEQEKKEEEKTISYLDVLNTTSVGNIITNISPNTKASFFNIDYKANITVKNASGKAINSGDSVGTGYTVSVKTDNETFNYIISVAGDVNGDAKISASDYVIIKNKIMSVSSNLSSAQTYAADADKNGKIGATDYVLIKNIIMK